MQKTLDPVAVGTALDDIPYLDELRDDIGDLSSEERELLAAMDSGPETGGEAAVDPARAERIAALAIQRIQRQEGVARLLTDLAQIPPLRDLESHLRITSDDEESLLRAMDAGAEDEVAGCHPMITAERAAAVAAGALAHYEAPALLDVGGVVLSEGITILRLYHDTQVRFGFQGDQFDELAKQVTAVASDLGTMWRTRARDVMGGVSASSLGPSRPPRRSSESADKAAVVK